MFFAVMDNPLLSYTRVKKTDYDMEDKVKNKIRKDVIKWELEFIVEKNYKDYKDNTFIDYC